MTPERWRQVESVLDAALERAAEDRRGFLDEACPGDPDLRREVESLLAVQPLSHELMEAPAASVGALFPDSSTETMTGRRIGAYRILREIGRGGMGTVYLGERADDQFCRQVAIKLVKRGMDTDAILRRFRNEQRILAGLDHPNIARLLDGGTTEDGLSYFIMDYADGQPIDAYCDTRRLPIAERLRLFRAVCSAVHHAHQHGVVHRDLKPSNIIVTTEGIPKLLDFGIAKLLSPDSSLPTLGSTATALRPMTPEYASPEQVSGEAVSPASDIYSLGVLLYELLTGHRPFRFKTRAPEEIARVIREEVPEKPSQAISRTEEIPGAHDAVARTLTPISVSAARNEEPGQLRRRLSGDLDNIALMALRKEPERRYASAEQFAEDIRRHMEGRPVIAHKDTLDYRSRKFIRRNKTGVLTAALIVILLLALIGVSVYRFPRRDAAIAKAIASLAVLPLENLSGDSEQEYFSDGMTEALIADLSKIGSLRVTSRTSVMQYKGTRQSLPEIGQRLKVDALIEGSVQRVGDRVQITVQLIHAATDRHLWAERYERDVGDILVLQNEVARAIAQEIKIKLTSQEQARLTSARPVNREAYVAYLKGRHFWNKRSETELHKAIAHFQQAIDKDPGYAPAYAGLCDSYFILGFYGHLPPKETFPRAKEAARKALEIDETFGEARSSLAQITWSYDWDWVSPEREFKRALELSPNYATAHQWYAQYLRLIGRAQESWAAIKRAQEIEPLSLVINLFVGILFYWDRQYDQAIDQYQKVIDIDPSFVRAYRDLALAYEQKGRYEEATAACQKAITYSDGSPMAIAALGRAYAVAGKKAEAQKVLKQLKALSKDRYISPYYIATIYAGLGEKDQAFAWLEKAYEERSGWLTLLDVQPLFDNLRPDPQFADLLWRIGLSP